ncbi:CRP/FNR family transcriptional regulator, cyclic AMP receptor protein [Variovorax sp. HW608]|uniref:Crp/Fnr family transcriptional regulator n=1 Tax=Variovorax sp. HW608 TaxID=1034889 RepID=UPI00081F9A5C|nr:Crp/Fnr family transcriptional regulator [Variovorax sp. HW608]SCK57407.1 CRP/FNR family transcriptional regulator, cyclic AMP receptor protein [Variovorax sp. HW608]
MSSASDRLPQSLLDAIAPRGVTRAFPAHAILINEGDTTDSLYIVLSGRVKVYASSEDGREVVLTEYGPGEYFGELAIDGEKRSASIKALGPCTCRVVQGTDLRQFLVEQPDFAVHLTRKLIRMVRRLTDQVRSMALQDVYGRMVRVLTELSDPVGEERLMRNKLTQQDIADRIGASREMVNRVMKELTAGGYIGQRNGRMVILRKLPSAW